jgi:hypothetical protein
VLSDAAAQLSNDSERLWLSLDLCKYTAVVIAYPTRRRDVRVMESFGIMDYSLLVGVHYFSETSAKALKQKAQQVCGCDGSAIIPR